MEAAITNDGRTKPYPKPRTGQVKKRKSAKPAKPTPPSEPSDFSCLMRAKHNNKKISTVVHPKDVNKFQLAYANLLKGNMDALKKMKKTKTAKTKAT